MPARLVALTRSLLALSTHPVRGFKDYFYIGAKKIDQNTVLLVCDYGPGGNVLGGTMYQRA